MDSEVAFTIIGCVLGFVGIMFNIFPKQINQKLMGDLTEEAIPGICRIQDNSRWGWNNPGNSGFILQEFFACRSKVITLCIRDGIRCYSYYFCNNKIKGIWCFSITTCNNVFNTRCNSLLYSFRIDSLVI